MLSALADIQLDAAIVAGLRQRGLDVVRAQDRGLCAQPDEVVLATATAEGRIVLTNDVDFLAIHAAWQGAGQPHAGIVWWRLRKYPVGEAVRRIFAYAAITPPDAAANTVHYL